ncbi:MAG TPA: DUF3267 domain-containing protein [Planococcus sp. (in: firmicutes)]|nr:DUF3267 domain-containing protein [Planococcus sp. (in: firmicutes)]
MHCWKTINVKKQYGFDRLFTLSMLTGFGVFMVFYIVIGIFFSADLSDQYFLAFILSVIAIYPIHKFCHFFPLLKSRQCVRLVIKKRFGFLPLISLRVNEPVPKMQFILSLITPFILINSLILLLALSFPTFSHYFAMLFAYHVGLCLTDLIYMKNLARSPKDALIEETENGFEILLPEPTV